MKLVVISCYLANRCEFSASQKQCRNSNSEL